MKDSFVFYRSFMDSINTVPKLKDKYLLLESIIKLGLFSKNNDNIEENFITFSAKLEQKLSKNLHILGVFYAIKPQIIAN